MKLKRIFAVFIASALLFLAFPAVANAEEAFYITSYDIDMKVNSDNSYQITETIKVTFTGQRHGIIRSIPNETYNGRRVKIKEIDVDGKSFSTSSENGELNIKIGDADSYASEHETYIISYDYQIGYDGLDDMDELYFNLLGSSWDCSIDNITFNIVMPYTFDEKALNFTSGAYADTEAEGVSYSVNGNTITGTLAHLNSFESLTIALPLEEGYFKDVKIPLDISEEASSACGAVILLGSVFYWFKNGRGKKLFPTVEFYPPEGITPADAGFIIDSTVDNSDLSSLILYWAAKGNIAITQGIEGKKFSKHEYTFTWLKELDGNAKGYEHTMFNKLFSCGGNSGEVTTKQLEEKFYTVVERVRNDIKRQYTELKKTRLFTEENSKCRTLLTFWGWAALWAPLQFGVAQSDGFDLFFALLLLFACAIVYAPFVLTTGIARKWHTSSLLKKITIFLLGLPCALVSMAYIFICFSFEVYVGALIGLAASAIIALLSALCYNRTPYGLEVMQKLLGFKQFLSYAEADRIKLLCGENKNYFYDMLPYALVMGITDKFAHAFDDILLEPPQWYNGGNYAYFEARSFARDISHGLSSVSSTLVSSPSSSGGGGFSGGSSGGGFSGGGSGGGGGSSW